MKILVYGAGVLGSIYAVKLHKAGNEVKLLARGKTFDIMNEKGIIIDNKYTKKITKSKIPMVKELKADDYYDFIVVVMQKNQIASILPILAKNNRVPTIIFLGNNAKGRKEYVDAVGAERVLLGFFIGGFQYWGLKKQGTSKLWEKKIIN